MAQSKKHVDFKQFFVSFYKGFTHYTFYSRLVHSVQEVKDDIEKEYGKVSDLVIDQVI